MQVSPKLRRADNTFIWFCPACKEAHPLPDGWNFNGNLESPTFSPSFRHAWRDRCCHYVMTDGKVAYCPDCTHDMKGQTIPMPDLPPSLQDNN